MMRGPAVNIDVIQGKDQWHGFRLYRVAPRDIVTANGVTTDPGIPLDLTGWTFKAAFASGAANNKNEMTLDNSHFAIRTDLVGREGQVWVVMWCPAAKTALMTASGRYDVTAISPNGYKIEIGHGTYVFYPAAREG